MPVPPSWPCVACVNSALFGHLAEVPALAVEVDLLPVDAVLARRQLVEAARTASMVSTEWWPMRSNRKPSTL